MPKPAAKTTLYNLIDAGHLARHAMLRPLLEHGLEPGDDAILFALSDPEGITKNDLCQLTGLKSGLLDMRLDRLSDAGVLELINMGEQNLSGARLSEKGVNILDILSANWQQLDGALLGELGKKDRKKLRKILRRFIKLLNL